MLEVNATHFAGASVALLLVLCIWWFIVEWGFKRSANSTNRLENNNGVQAGAGKVNRKQSGHDHPDRKKTDHTRASQKNRPDQSSKLSADARHSTPAPQDSTTAEKVAVQPTSKISNNRSPVSTSSASTLTAGNSTAVSSNTGGSQQPGKAGPGKADIKNAAPETQAISNSSQTPQAASKTKTAAGKNDNRQASPAITAVSSRQPADVSNDQTTNKSKPHQKSSESINTDKKHNQPVSNPGSPNKARHTSGPTDTTKESPQHGTTTKKVPSAQSSKYQTAAKTQSPSVRSEASIQIPTTARTENSKGNDPLHAMLNLNSDPQIRADRTSGANTASMANKAPAANKTPTVSADTSVTPSATHKTRDGSALSNDTKTITAKPPENDESTGTKHAPEATNTQVQNVNSISVAATRKVQPIHPQQLKSVPNTPVAPDPAKSNTAKTGSTTPDSIIAKGNATKRKQSPIERAVAQQISDDQFTAQKNTEMSGSAEPQPDKPGTNTDHGDTALRAQLANSERRIRSLQSTLNNLQQNQSSSAVYAPAQMDSQHKIPHNRPALMSKVRILDTPRS